MGDEFLHGTAFVRRRGGVEGLLASPLALPNFCGRLFSTPNHTDLDNLFAEGKACCKKCLAEPLNTGSASFFVCAESLPHPHSKHVEDFVWKRRTAADVAYVFQLLSFSHGLIKRRVAARRAVSRLFFFLVLIVTTATGGHRHARLMSPSITCEQRSLWA